MPSRSRAPSTPLLVLWTLVLFGVWSHSFIAIGYLLGSEKVPARFDWLSLTVARFVPVLFALLPVVLGPWRRETVRVVRRRWRRLLVCGLLAVPGYAFALYFGQQHGVPPPIASLETALAPLFLMMLGAGFLGERLSTKKLLGFAVALAGLALIATAKEGGEKATYAVVVGITALAPLQWAVHSVLTKAVSHECAPALWAYLVLVFGSFPLLFVLPFHGAREMAHLDASGWAALLFLSLFCTVFGNAAWTWLVKHLPASTVGFTIFLNPPLTTTSKAVLAAALPATFAFQIVPLEWVGSAIVLVGMAVALVRRRGRSTAPFPDPAVPVGE